MTSSSDTFMSFQISPLTVALPNKKLKKKTKKRRAEEELSTLISKIHREIYSVENIINDSTAPLLRRFYKYFIYNSL